MRLIYYLSRYVAHERGTLGNILIPGSRIRNISGMRQQNLTPLCGCGWASQSYTGRESEAASLFTTPCIGATSSELRGLAHLYVPVAILIPDSDGVF